MTCWIGGAVVAVHSAGLKGLFPSIVFPRGSSTPNRVERANTNALPNERNDEFWKNPRKKLALDASAVEATLASAVLNVPRLGSAGLSRRSRAYVMPTPETSVGWLYKGICSGLMVRFRFAASTRR